MANAGVEKIILLLSNPKKILLQTPSFIWWEVKSSHWSIYRHQYFHWRCYLNRSIIGINCTSCDNCGNVGDYWDTTKNNKTSLYEPKLIRGQLRFQVDHIRATANGGSQWDEQLANSVLAMPQGKNKERFERVL